MTFKQFIPCSVFVAAVFAFLATAPAKAAELAETPAAVQKTISAQIGDGKLDEIDRTNEDGETTFDVSYTTKTSDDAGFTVAEDGTVLSVEVTLADTPELAQKTIRTQAQGWQLDDINKNVADTDISYEADVSKGPLEKSFTVAEDGTLEDTEVTLAETPAAVQTAITGQVADGSVQSIDENFDPDGDSFDVEAVTTAGGRKSFSVAPDGTLLSVEVPMGKIPPPARKTIRERISGGKLLRIDKSLVERKRGVLPYEVSGRKNGKPFDFSVAPRGGFLGMDE